MELPPIYGYVIWLLPEKKSAVKFQKIIEGLAQTYRSISFPPHVTLTPCPDEQPFENLKIICNELARNFKPFQLDILSTGSLNNEYQSLYIQINKSVQLAELRKSARKKVGLHQEVSYMPHLSLFYGFLSDDQRREITDTLVRSIQGKFIAGRLALVELKGTPDIWQIVYSVSMEISGEK